MFGNIQILGWQGVDTSTGTIGGGGTINRLAKFTGPLTIGDSMYFDNGVSVGLGTILPDASAILELSSTTQGFLSTRMTTPQRNLIAAPATGLFIYNLSTNLFNYWDGVTWQAIDSTATSEWILDGNSNGALKYIGTNDAFDFPIYTNGIEAARFLSTNQYFGVGTTIATARIHSKGSGATSATLNFITANSGAISAIESYDNTAIQFGATGYVASSGRVYTLVVDGDAFDWGQEILNTRTTGTPIGLKITTNGSIVGGEHHGIEISSINAFGEAKAIYVTNGDIIQVADASSNVAFGNSSTSTDTKLLVHGKDATLANYAFKAKTNVGGGLLEVRNDSLIYVNSFASLMINYGGFLNTFFGDSAGNQTISNDGNTGIGRLALNGLTAGFQNVAIGNNALKVITAGGGATAIGFNSQLSTTGSANTSVGQNTLQNNTTGALNTVLGVSAGFTGNGSSNVFLGYQAGYYETGSNKLFIDNAQRASETDARVKALIYGIFDAATASQYLTVNGNLGVGIDALAQVHFFGMLNNVNQRLEPIAGITEDTSAGSAADLGGPITNTLETIAIVAGTVVTITSKLNCQKVGGGGAGAIGDGCGYIITGTFKNVGGTVTQIGSTDNDHTAEDLPLNDAFFTISGTNVLIQGYNGDTNQTSWTSITKTKK